MATRKIRIQTTTRRIGNRIQIQTRVSNGSTTRTTTKTIYPR